MKYTHIPVMLKEVLNFLEVKNGGYYIDCTLGGAGYTIEIVKLAGSNGKVLAIDLDDLAIKNAQEKIKINQLNNIILKNENYRNLGKVIDEEFAEKIRFDGIVFDLGLSTAQLEDRSRGFSFLVDAPLDMAFGQVQGIEHTTTEEIVNKYSEEKLRNIIREYGEERFAGRIAGAIIKARRIASVKTTFDLVKIIESAVPANYRRGKIHPATRTFQALRIETNDELGGLKEVLPQALELLKPGGRLVIVSFHSLEDRIVKNFFKDESKKCVCSEEVYICNCQHKPKLKIITKKIIKPSDQEIRENPRARSAKLRVAEKI